jgi:alginate O-acetyltransferase complex protein AlgI
MPIVSLKFLAFVLVSLAIFYVLPGKVQNLFLLLVSYYFYSTWAWWYALILLAATLFNFFYARLLHRAQRRRRLILWIGVGINGAVYLFFLLATIFYADFNSLIRNFGLTIAILIPVGLAYRVLECISYLADINLKIGTPCSNFIDFALYLAYFPKLISGPIERARKFLPLLAEKKSVDNERFARSILFILVGLFQTIVLAGALTILVPMSTLKQPQDYSSSELIIGLLGFAFFLYNQFAGYTNIVRGVSGFFGIELSRNFAHPFFSKDFSDYWKRWHISLSQWLRDYIYLPSSRALLRRNPSRTNMANLILPPILTMLISGVWHGARPHLLVWGALNGFYIVVENVLSLFRSVTPSTKKPLWRRVLSSLVVICLALLAVIPFSMSLATSKVFLYRLAFAWNGRLPDLRPLAIIGVSLLLDWIQFRRNDEFIFLKWPSWVQSLSIALTLLAVFMVYNLQNAPATFVYP